MLYHFYDTETSGLIDFKADLMAPHQPRIVQIAALLCDEEGEVVQELNAIIKPDGWDSIPEGAIAIHGITFERCQEEGRCMKEVLAEFNEMKTKAQARAAYNISYDKKMLAREAGYHGIPHDSSGIESYCVMQMSKPICKIAPTDKMMATGRKTFKTPKLSEAYQFFFGKELEGAHGALADVHATKEIFYLIKKEHPDYFTAEPAKPPYVPREEQPAVLPLEEAATMSAF